ncbi:MAG: ribbon-helix-helix domain-containing protein [Planctomycetota bacterium]|nr:ribbon-helix-helix domain-containing protein [Planctomycetota bacterium]
MPAVKMAISLQEPLYRKAKSLARKMRIPRSRLIAEALEEYLRKRETQALVDSLNEAYANGLDEDDRRMLESMRRLQAKRTEGDEW